MIAPPSNPIDILIIGAGMAGAGLAAKLAPYRSITLIEAEEFSGYHATGRSAAFWQESYGGLGVQPLTSASEQELLHPKPSFSDRPFLLRRGAYMIGRDAEADQVDQFTQNFREQGVLIERLSAGEFAQHFSGVKAEWTQAAMEASCKDIDVAALHQAYLRQAKAAGAKLIHRAKLERAQWRDGMWHVKTSIGPMRARYIVNAAGAWADDVALRCEAAPIGITAYRRTMVQLRLHADVPASLPLISHIGGEFYFKGAGEGRIWLSPHDETRSPACDAAPEEMDVALAIERFQSVVDWPIAAVERKWAGLRSFAPDRLPVFGADPALPSFIWCAGQGGFGIQTAPAISSLLAAQLGAPEVETAMKPIDIRTYSPARFHR